MSLLLDALKKAAQEKQNADSADIKAETDAELNPEQDTGSTHQEYQNKLDDSLVLEELELDDEALSQSDVMQDGISPDYKEESGVNFQQQRIIPTP